jgi:enoyl-CoA hydratase
LNRPQALNALSDAMRLELAAALPRWVRSPEVYALVIASSSERAFCAGGDVREMAELGRTRMGEARRALADEYTLNWSLDRFTKPTIALIDGIVMGGGVGLSLYGTHRVAGERYRFAMPETGIGLFPDDGVSSVLARLPDEIGMYLALTGRTIGHADAYHLGLATHCIPAAQFGEIRAAIADADPVDPILDSRHVDPGRGDLDELSLLQRSPLSLAVTHRQMRLARGWDLRTALENDLRLACRFLEGTDFYEGVRAFLIARDRTPRWQPAGLDEVTEAMIERHFAPLGADDLRLPPSTELHGFNR